MDKNTRKTLENLIVAIKLAYWKDNPRDNCLSGFIEKKDEWGMRCRDCEHYDFCEALDNVDNLIETFTE